MEILVGAVIIIILLALLGVDLWYIFLGIIALVALAGLFVTVFFAVSTVWLLRSERRSGVFVRFSEGKRFDSAVYEIDGAEYGNIFPAEFVLRDRLYKPDETVSVRLSKSRRVVFDKNAVITTAVGLPMSIIITAAFGGGLLFLLGVI